MKTLVRRACPIVGILVLAFSVRWLHVSTSRTDGPFRADAGKYVRAAANLRFHCAHSLDVPTQDPPITRTDLAPGYPLFLTLFLTGEASGFRINFRALLLVQALMGALTATVTYLLAQEMLPKKAAMVSALLTALSPHLIALDGYVLTETLFTFAIMLGLLMFVLGWKSRNLGLVLLCGIVLSGSVHIRTISMFLPFAVAPLLLLETSSDGSPDRKRSFASFGAFFGGWVLIAVLYWIFVQLTILDSDRIERPPKEYTDVRSTITYVMSNSVPPVWFVEGETHVFAGNSESRAPTSATFLQEPGAYLAWNLWGRLITPWQFDNAYNGDVYIYPMHNRGFTEVGPLGAIHATMRVLHWPLFAASLVGCAVIALRGPWLPREKRVLLLPAIAFAYFLAVLWGCSWLPRYSIPLRPLSYVLVAACVTPMLRGLSNRWHSKIGDPRRNRVLHNASNQDPDRQEGGL